MTKILKLVRAGVLAFAIVSAAAVPAFADGGPGGGGAAGGGGAGGGGGAAGGGAAAAINVRLVADLVSQDPLAPNARGKAAYAFDGVRSRFCAEMINTGLAPFTSVEMFEGPADSLKDLGTTVTLPSISLFPPGTFFCLVSQVGSVVPRMAAGDLVQFRLNDGTGTVVTSGTFHT